MTNIHLAVQFFFQLAIILLFCRVVGALARHVGQPQVVAEMIAGVMLGPSFLGLYCPEFQAWIFPWDSTQSTRDTQSYLFPAAQLGLALYMFIVGMEFRVDIIRKNFGSSVAVSMAGMLAPFLLGGCLGWFLYHNTSLFPEKTTSSEAMLFLGASLCITAFPMLARIIHFKKLSGTMMGTVAIGAGAIDDAAAWCLLALVLASFDDDPSKAIVNIGGGLTFAVVAIMIIRPILGMIYQRWLVRDEKLTESGLVIALATMATGACVTDAIGLHAVFGAFLMGSIMPRPLVARQLTELIQPLTVALLLPLFFTYSGLNTRIGLLNTPSLWLMCGLILITSIIGKGVACYLASRACGLSHREGMGIGALMNSRGLMELIIINIGLQRGVITPELFACLVIMAVITTLMASPIFDLLYRDTQTKAAEPIVS